MILLKVGSFSLFFIVLLHGSYANAACICYVHKRFLEKATDGMNCIYKQEISEISQLTNPQ